MISTQFKLEAECKLLTVTLLVATAICACLTYGLVKVSTRAGIHGPPDPGTDRSVSIRDFQNYVCPGLVQSEILKFFR